ncbi:MAG: hypothetical protein GX294_06955, partial [Candidatus Cloacimonetes bacterium]|nr:hypothetical protein [Candidatus Cloacimonadota bacterium]
MRINRKDNSSVDIPLDEIDNIVYLKGTTISASDELRDADGNVYKTVKIGNQIWMAENLRTGKYIDGTPIPEVKEKGEWEKATAAAFCWYNN